MALRRNPEKAREWERRSRKPLKRTPLKRSTKPIAKSTKRGRKKRAKQTGDDTGFAGWIRRLPCVGCYAIIWKHAGVQGVAGWSGVHHEKNMTVMHLVTRGAGHGVVTDHVTKDLRPAGTPCVVPGCVICHGQQEGRSDAFFAELGLDGWKIARIVAAAWKLRPEYIRRRI